MFIKELEVAMTEGRADIAVHSMKDVPVAFPDGFGLHAICERENPFDAFVSNHFNSLEALPLNAVVGTSSLRRQCQLRKVRPDLVIKDLRGNVNTRLAKLDAGEYDAIVLAAAGLIRLGMRERIQSEMQAELSLPAVGQGATEAESNLERLNTFNNNVNEYVETVNESLIPKGTNEGKGGKRSRRTRIKKRKKAKKTRKRTLL